MYVSVSEQADRRVYANSALKGARILVTGVDPGLAGQSGTRARGSAEADSTSTDLVAAMCAAGAKLLIHADPDQRAGAEKLLASWQQLDAPLAANARLVCDEIASTPDAVKFAQAASRQLGSITAAINFISLAETATAVIDGPEDLEEQVYAALSSRIAATQVLANRMRLTWSEGAIINVLQIGSTDPIVAMLTRDALRGATALEARRWAEAGIGIHAVVQDPMTDGGEPTAYASLQRILFNLIGSRRPDLTGLTYEAA